MMEPASTGTRQPVNSSLTQGLWLRFRQYWKHSTAEWLEPGAQAIPPSTNLLLVPTVSWQSFPQPHKPASGTAVTAARRSHRWSAVPVRHTRMGSRIMVSIAEHLLCQGELTERSLNNTLYNWPRKAGLNAQQTVDTSRAINVGTLPPS